MGLLLGRLVLGSGWGRRGDVTGWTLSVVSLRSGAWMVGVVLGCKDDCECFLRSIVIYRQSG